MSKSKLFRLFSLLLAFSLSFTIFGLSASAAGEDFDSDLSNWVVSDPNYVVVNKYTYGNITLFDSYFKPIPSDKGFHTGFFYDATNLTAGNSYTLKFKLYNTSQLKSVSSTFNITDSAYYAPFTSYNGALLIGLGSLDSSGNFVFSTTDGTGIAINKDNYLSYFGNTVSITFTMPNAVNSAIGIYYIDSAQTGNNCHFYMGDFSLTSNTVDVQAAVDSAIGAVDDMKTELSGKLDEGFDGLLSGMGDMFSNLTDSIGGFFSDLGDNISSGLENLGSSLLDGIKSLFVPSDEELSDFKTKLEQLLYDKLGIIWQVSDFFAEFITSICSMLWDNSSTDLDFVFPGIDFTLNGKRYYLWDDTSVDMSFLQTNPVFSAFYGMYKVILIIIFSFALFKYAERTFEEVIRH